jgi:hypothetical protein
MNAAIGVRFSGVEYQSRMRSARMLALGAPVFGFGIWALLASGFSGLAHLIAIIAIAVLPFWILAIAIRARHRSGTWRFGGRDIQALAAVLAALIAIPAVWWFVAAGGDRSPSSTNCVLGCLLVFVPISLPFILVFGLALAAESAEENDSS